MKIKNSSDSDINLSRGATSLTLTPGVNDIPMYEWVETAVRRNKDLEYIIDVELTKTGAVAESSFVEVKKPNVRIRRKAK